MSTSRRIPVTGDDPQPKKEWKRPERFTSPSSLTYLRSDIDQTALDKELVHFPAAVGELYDAIPALKNAVVRAKEERDRYYAEQYLTHRNNAVPGSKPTEKEIESRILVDPLYVANAENLYKVSLELMEAEAALDTLRRRESVYSMLVQLYSAQYWTLKGVL